jgi:hypothetical protein
VKINSPFEDSNGGRNSRPDLLEWLEQWYSNQCDGKWEHAWGIKIDTLDNPGWKIEIDLVDTKLEYAEANFQEGVVGKTDSDWIQLKISGGKFTAFCGPRNLQAALELFRGFANSV